MFWCRLLCTFGDLDVVASEIGSGDDRETDSEREIGVDRIPELSEEKYGTDLKNVISATHNTSS